LKNAIKFRKICEIASLMLIWWN